MQPQTTRFSASATIRVLTCAALALVIVAAKGPAFGQSMHVSPELAKIIEAAKKEGKVTIKSTQAVFGGAAGAKVAEAGMNKMFGTSIAVEWSPGPPYAPLAAQMMQEKQAGQPASTDVYVGTAVQIVPYLQRDLFRSIDWKSLLPARLRPEMIEGGGRALRIYTSLPGIVYNLERAPWVVQIDALSDLLDARHKGKFHTTPFLAGFDILLAKELWGIDKTRTYIEAFSKQIAGVVGCDAHDRIASGEVLALAMDCSGGSPNTLKFRGKGILGHQMVGDLVSRRYGYILIPTNAAQPNAATLLGVYIATKEGQDRVMWDYMGMDLTDFDDSNTRKVLAPVVAKGKKVVDVTIDWWSENRAIGKAHLEMTRIIRGR